MQKNTKDIKTQKSDAKMQKKQKTIAPAFST